MAQLSKDQSVDDQIDQALLRGQAQQVSQFCAVAGYFDTASHKVVIEFQNGAEFRFPPKLGQGLEKASEAELSNVEISPSGLGIHWPDIDAGLSIPHLVEGIYGTKKWMESLYVNAQ